MIELLENMGQGGNHGLLHPMYYHNSCLIADHDTAWVFETAGKHWAAERVTDVRSISNIITIGNHWDRASDDLVSFAVSKGWCKDEADFDFGACYSDFLYSTFAAGRHRFCQTRDSLQANAGKVDLPLRCVYCGITAQTPTRIGGRERESLVQKSVCIPALARSASARPRDQ